VDDGLDHSSLLNIPWRAHYGRSDRTSDKSTESII
jgi:hypothetical protein